MKDKDTVSEGDDKTYKDFQHYNEQLYMQYQLISEGRLDEAIDNIKTILTEFIDKLQ